jgi:tetratricopeptide (TPR) repeat protein
MLRHERANSRRSPGALICLLLFFLLAWSTDPAMGADAGTAATVHSDPLNSDPVVKDAYQRFYDLDFEGALARFSQVRSAHPDDPLATAYVLHCILFRELYNLDLLDTTFYANDGFLTGKHTVSENPAVRDQVFALTDAVLRQADDRLKGKPNDENALFARGWARSQKAAYMGMVERSFGPALRLALQARSDHEHLLQEDPAYVDAKMVVGIYQYVTGSLRLGFKILVGFAGITGSKSKGMELLRDSAARGTITSIESRTCIALFLRREGRYKEAIEIIRSQIREYPRDFLFALEEGNLLKDDGQWQAAESAYRKLIADARKPNRYPNAHVELAWFGLGDTLRGQNQNSDAVAAYEQAAHQPTISSELKRRSLLAAGQVYDLMKQHDKARGEYEAVVAAGPDSSQAELAKKYIRSGYTK